MANPLQDFGALVAAIASAYQARFGDIERDVIVVEDLEQLLADVGVPEAGLALMLTEAVNGFLKAKATAAPDPGGYWFYHPGPRVER